MIQLNLLPHVKLDYIKAQRMRRLVLTIAFIASAASVGILVLFFAANLYQKKHLTDISKNISSDITQLNNVPDINKILTVQNQLGSLSGLHASKPAASRVFNYLNELTPASVDITNFNIDLTKQTMTLTGTSNALSSINQYVDVLKLTTFTADEQTSPKPAFSQVVLANFGISSQTTSTGQPASYTIDLNYDPNIFNITYNNVALSIPSTTTTRLEEQQPTDLFQTPTTTNSSTGGH